VLLQSVLVGKAREVYSAMTVEQSAQYDYVKQAVLKAYEQVPEAYHQNFRNCRIQDKQTYTEFARDKELLDHWCASKEVVKDFEKLHQLILVEEFMSCRRVTLKRTLINKRLIAFNRQQCLLMTTHSSSAARHVQVQENKSLMNQLVTPGPDSRETISSTMWVTRVKVIAQIVVVLITFLRLVDSS